MFFSKRGKRKPQVEQTISDEAFKRLRQFGPQRVSVEATIGALRSQAQFYEDLANDLSYRLTDPREVARMIAKQLQLMNQTVEALEIGYWHSNSQDVELRLIETVEAGYADPRHQCDLCGSTYNTKLRITYNFGVLRLCPGHPCEAEFTEEEKAHLYRRMLS